MSQVVLQGVANQRELLVASLVAIDNKQDYCLLVGKLTLVGQFSLVGVLIFLVEKLPACERKIVELLTQLGGRVGHIYAYYGAHLKQVIVVYAVVVVRWSVRMRVRYVSTSELLTKAFDVDFKPQDTSTKDQTHCGNSESV